MSLNECLGSQPVSEQRGDPEDTYIEIDVEIDRSIAR